MTNSSQKDGKKESRQVDRWYLVYYLRVFDGMSRNIIGHVVDISEKGVMLICDRPLEVNADYRLRMCLPNRMKDREEMLFSATSRWCRSDANPDFYLVGFQIHDLKPDSSGLINELIRDFSYNEKR